MLGSSSMLARGGPRVVRAGVRMLHRFYIIIQIIVSEIVTFWELYRLGIY